MKMLGFILIAAAFLGGSLAAVWHETDIEWNYFVTMMALGVVGVLMARLGHKRIVSDHSAVAANMEDVMGSLQRIVANTTQLDEQKLSINTYDMRGRIDAMISSDIITFADARESITAMFGLRTYADVMGHFAAGERYLNRVWSASADGYVDEVNTYIGRSKDQFAQAMNLLRNANPQKPA